jgi:hypothetical protein
MREKLSAESIVDLHLLPMLGPCCACERVGPRVRNWIMLHKRAVIAGHGWGCFVCGLPPDGASYVLCDDRFDLQRRRNSPAADIPARTAGS